MEISSFENYTDLTTAAADRICRIIKDKPKAVLILPTGNTPLGVFKVLVERYRAGLISFKDAYLFELDEYLHESGQDGPVLFNWLEEVFLDKVDFQKGRVFSFNPKTQDPDQECAQFQEKIEALGGADLVVLGLGPNGHLAMNEPGTSFDAPTRLVHLTPATIESNSAYWEKGNKVPLQGMTIGMNVFTQSKETMLLVSGSSKREILQKVINTPATIELPATILHTISNANIYADKGALRIS